MKIRIIAGHGGSPFDAGAVGGGHNEATLVRRLAERIKALGGASVEILDPSVDWFRTGGINAALKALIGNDPLLELHMDSAGAGAKGGHVIIAEGLTPDAHDNALAKNIAAMFPGRAQIIVKRSNLANVNRAKAHGINYRLLEVCFISDASDRNKFINEMDKVAEIILDSFGIKTGKDWFDMATKAELEALLKPIKDDVAAIKAEVFREDDPTGRNRKMKDHDHIKWIASEVAVIKDGVKRIEEELAE